MFKNLKQNDLIVFSHFHGVELDFVKENDLLIVLRIEDEFDIQFKLLYVIGRLICLTSNLKLIRFLVYKKDRFDIISSFAESMES